MHREGGHAGQVLDDVCTGHDLAQITGHRALEGQQFEGAGLGPLTELLDFVDGAEDFLGHFDVLLEQGNAGR